MPQPLFGRLVPRRVLAALVLPVLLLTGCAEQPRAAAPSTSDVVTSDVADVEVTGGLGEKPTVAYDGRFETDTTERVVLEEGDGPVVALGQKVQLNYLGVNGRDGTEFDTSYDTPDQPASFVLEQGQLINGFITGLEGVKAGSRVLVGISPEDGYGPSGGQPEAGIEQDDSLLFVIDVISSSEVLKRATGTPVPPLAGLPTVSLGPDGAPTIDVPSGPPSTKTLAQALITGAGAPVKEGQTLTVHFTIVAWETGEVIESSWAKGSPVPLPLVQGQIMPALVANLTGEPVGSQVMIVVPPEVASEGAAEPVTDTLVFVFDILDAQ